MRNAVAFSCLLLAKCAVTRVTHASGKEARHALGSVETGVCVRKAVTTRVFDGDKSSGREGGEGEPLSDGVDVPDALRVCWGVCPALTGVLSGPEPRAGGGVSAKNDGVFCGGLRGSGAGVLAVLRNVANRREHVSAGPRAERGASELMCGARRPDVRRKNR